jgi:hypothetical protein
VNKWQYLNEYFFHFNSNKSPTRCNNFTVYYPDVCLQLNMFRPFSRPSSGAQWLQWQPLVLPLYRGVNRAQLDYYHDTKVKPKAATAVIELLMMGGKTPETCWAVNKRQDNKLENCCIWLVICLNCTMMYGLTNLKFTFFTFIILWINANYTNQFCRHSFSIYFCVISYQTVSIMRKCLYPGLDFFPHLAQKTLVS